jgi:hypothetical protein
MKKLFLVLVLACCIMPRAHGHSPIFYPLFRAKWTPLQIMIWPTGLFDMQASVYGIDLTLLGYQDETYGLSCGVVSVHGGHYGIGIALGNGVECNTGLMCGVINIIQRNRGVALGVWNRFSNEPGEDISEVENFLQIGLFNYAPNGLQIGVLNHNPNALIPWMVLFNYSPRGEFAPAAADRQKEKHGPRGQNKERRK